MNTIHSMEAADGMLHHNKYDDNHFLVQHNRHTVLEFGQSGTVGTIQIHPYYRDCRLGGPTDHFVA